MVRPVTPEGKEPDMVDQQWLSKHPVSVSQADRNAADESDRPDGQGDDDGAENGDDTDDQDPEVEAEEPPES